MTREVWIHANMETIESVENFLYFHVSLNQACRQKSIVLPVIYNKFLK